MLDRFAVIERQRSIGVGGHMLDALLVTSLTIGAPKIALNMEVGDAARVEERDCTCLFGQLGFRTHLSEIRSFEKMTGEGVTFARTNLKQILETSLPATFGGTAVDYQLAEEEGARGTTRLVLRIRRSVGSLDESAVKAVLLSGLEQGGAVARYQAEMWRNADSIDIRRENPLATRAGKVLPFHLLRRAVADEQPR